MVAAEPMPGGTRHYIDIYPAKKVAESVDIKGEDATYRSAGHHYGTVVGGPTGGDWNCSTSGT